MEIDYEPCFLDEAVLRALGSRPEARLFHRERERAYRVGDVEERARAFDALNAAWYARLGLARPLLDALTEQPAVLAGVVRCAVGRPPQPRDAGADLLVRAPDAAGGAVTRLLRILLAPETLLEPATVTPFLRRELQHVADMLDPAFGYRPELPEAVGGPAHARLYRDRYRVVWDAAVDGRLVRAGRLPAGARARRREEFLRAFPALGTGTDDVFAAFFDGPAPTHAAIVAFVTAPAAQGRGLTGTCPLCGFPGVGVGADLTCVPATVIAEIQRDFPAWTPAQGCCRQCADLYRARPLSLAGAAALPGIR